MKTELAIFLIIVHPILFLGCGEKDVATALSESHVGVCQEPQLGTNELTREGEKSISNGVDQTLKELDADFLSITNYVYAEWAGARDAALRMRDKIMTLPSDIGKVYAQNMLDRILSLPINHLGLYERTHALDSIWRMGNVV